MTLQSSVCLTFSDGEEARITSPSGATIYLAARQAGIALAHDCLNGTCGTCRGALTDGAVAYQVDTAELALPEGDAAAVLICQARPTSPSVSVALPYSRASLLPEKKRKLRVTSKVLISDSVWEVRCKAEGLRLFDFLPGQYMRVTPDGRDFTRAFSPYTLPGAAEIGFLIREVKGGAMSAYLRNEPVEGEVWSVAGPFGIFYRRHTDAPSLYVAGGTGLAPILSMLADQRRLASATGPKKLIFGVSRRQDLFFADRLRALADEVADLTVVVTVIDAAAEGTARTGSVVDMLTEADFTSLGEHGAVYLCGPPGMVNAVRDRAATWNVPSTRTFTEEFLPS